MKREATFLPIATATLADVLERLASNNELAESRQRDLRSAVMSYANIVEQPPQAIPLDLASIRTVLDRTEPARLRISRKRWANVRSDLTAAIEASGLRPMFKTGQGEINETWARLLGAAGQPKIGHGLARFARWASERQVAPQEVDKALIDRFIADLEAASLVRNLHGLRKRMERSWNLTATTLQDWKLGTVTLTRQPRKSVRVRLSELPQSFCEDLDGYLAWAARPDPLDENARTKPLAPRTRRLRFDHIHSAVTAAVEGGTAVTQLPNLAALVEPQLFKSILRRLWEKDGEKLTAYAHGVSGSLVAIATEWVKVPDNVLVSLKKTRRKLGAMPFGLTEKNKILLRQFNDPRLLSDLLKLPDKIWRQGRRDLAKSNRAFVELQSALAIDLLLRAPLRMKNLSEMTFDQHLHWPQGPGKPALLVISGGETKNGIPLEFEVASVLGDRLLTYRNEIALIVTGVRPTAVFVTNRGKPRVQASIALAIAKTVRRNLGVNLTPHQFRHLAAKIMLDVNPGAFELVRELMGHKNMQTTTNFYAGIDTRRAGRTHSNLIDRLKDE